MMPKCSSGVWALNSHGHPCLLPTDSRSWKRVRVSDSDVPDLELKKVAAVSGCVWAVGCDHHVYVRVHSRDVPIHVAEVSYENQRWNPVEGFSGSSLLPSDRPGFSTEDGTAPRYFKDIRLPTAAWSWEQDWYIQESVGGDPTDKEGWQYAVDFPRQYDKDKHWNSCVRRRKWLRYRCFNAYDKWTPIERVTPSGGSNGIEDTILDVAVGGGDITGAPSGHLAVWCVTVMGRVLCRTDVSEECPEGRGWLSVSSDDRKEALQVSVGPMGLVWLVCWDGTLLARTFVNKDHLTGMNWAVVETPLDGAAAVMQVTIGQRAAWAVTRDDRIWFRKGVNAELAGSQRVAATGSGWVEMVGCMNYLSLGANNDQLFAIGASNRHLYFRTGVTPADPCGKKWKAVMAKMTLCRTVTTAAAQERLRRNSLSSLSSAVSSCWTDDSCVPLQSEDPSDSFHNSQPVWNLAQQRPTTPPQLIAATPEEPTTPTEEPTTPTDEPTTPTPAATDLATVAAQPMLPSVTSSSLNEAMVFKDEDEVQGRPRIMTGEEILALTREDESEGPKSIEDDLRSLQSTHSMFETHTHTSVQHGGKQQEVSGGRVAGGGDFEGSYESDASDTVIDFTAFGSPPRENEEKKAGKDLSMPDANGVRHEIGDTVVEHLHVGKSSNCKEVLLESSMEEPMTNNNVVCENADFDNDTTFEEYTDEDEGVQLLCVSAGACMAAGESAFSDWFQANSAAAAAAAAANSVWRKEILARLSSRDVRQLNGFDKFPLAVDRKNWVKTGKCQWFSESRSSWQDCEIELEQGKDYATLSLYSGKGKSICLDVLRITCVARHTDGSKTSTLKVVRDKQSSVIRLAMLTDQDADDWLAWLSAVCGAVRGVRGGAPKPTAMWCTSRRGDIFSHNISPHCYSNRLYRPSSMYWRQFGGHMKMVESNCAGVVWAVGYDGKVWLYSGGHGGGPFSGVESSSTGIFAQTDERCMHVYENQRWNPLTGFSEARLPTDRPVWSDRSGRTAITKDNVRLPVGGSWQWCTGWQVDYGTPGGTDKQGWQYASDFPRTYHGSKCLTDYVRRRRWRRKCRTATTGPWIELNTVKLADISFSLESDSNICGEIVLWAVSETGAVLVRQGLSRDHPEGEGWLPVPCDQKFVCVSVGARCRVWAIASTGAAYFRNGVSQHCPIGKSWFHVAAPQNEQLKMISVGTCSVWAVDFNKNLWFREEVADIFPEGTAWKHIANGVRHVSAGPHNQVWAVVDTMCTPEMSVKISSGVICCRTGITKQLPQGNGWATGNGSGWSYISARAAIEINSS